MFFPTVQCPGSFPPFIDPGMPGLAVSAAAWLPDTRHLPSSGSQNIRTADIRRGPACGHGGKCCSTATRGLWPLLMQIEHVQTVIQGIAAAALYTTHAMCTVYK